MSALFIRLFRGLGWIAFCGSIAVVLAVIILQAVHGPAAHQSCFPDPRMLACIRSSVFMGALTVTLALTFSIPVAIALSIMPRGRLRVTLQTLTILPLVTMPSIFGYAWMLLATSHIPLAKSIMTAIGWNRPGFDLWQSAFVLATWLWPIPALLISMSFRQTGRGAYQLALIDATPVIAFFKGALPELLAPGLTACVLVFLLAVLDPTIPPLVNVTQVWSVEMMAQAAASAKLERPVGQLFWLSWPMLTVIATAACAAALGLRRMSTWGPSEEPQSSKATREIGWAVCVLAIAFAAMLSLLPFVVFCVELWSGRSSPIAAIHAAAQTIRKDGLASLSAGLVASIISAGIALAVLSEPDWPRWRRRLSSLAFVGVITLAVMPPELTGAALIWLYARGDPGHWNIYDDSPLVWAAAMVCRFAFIPVCAARILSRRWGSEVDTIAQADGANRMQRLAHARLPMLRRVVLMCSALVLMLCMSEVAVSVLVQPVRYFGSSLAVQIDAQMHYGRQNQTIAMALLMIVPALGAVVLTQWAARKH